MSTPVLLFGAGRMGGALLKGWIANAIAPLIAVEPHPSAELIAFASKVLILTRIQDAPANIRAVVVAVKPQVLKTEAVHLRPWAENGSTMISIAAGVSTQTLVRMWGPNARVIRAMPNTPGSIGHGITALFARRGTQTKDKMLAQRLLAALGETVWVGRESLMDVVTAVSGSGPAYVFLLTEALTDAAVDLGLSRQLAEKLARATVTGSGALLAADATAISALRRNVTSPGGTTEAALRILTAKHGLSHLIKRAVAAARRRARQLGA